ncbi:MAG: hypothetical protein ABI579_02495 [Candidatus Sumerlaeota bacterium]
MIAAAVVWTVLTAHLAVMSRPALNHIENIFRGFLISHHVLSPEWKHYQPPEWDLIQHFVFYAPYGIFAGALGTLLGRWMGRLTGQIAEVTALGFGFSVAFYDEMQQGGLPDRLADFDDLFSGWAGTAVAFAVYLLVASLIARRKRRRARLADSKSEQLIST